MEASPSRRQGQGGEQAAAPPGTNTHKGKKKHLLSLSEGMDLGRQQGSSLRNRCFSAFLVWTGGLPGRKKESPSRRRVNTASAPGPDGQQGWAPGAGGSERRQHMQREAGGAGRQNPARALVDLPAHSQDKPSTGVSILRTGKDGERMGTTLLGYPHPVPLLHPHRTRVHWRLPRAQRVRKWQGQALSFSLDDKYLLPGDPLRGVLQGGKAE